MEDRNMSFLRFEDLRIYDKSVEYSQWLISNLGNAHSDAEENVINSFCRSAFNISLNIVEGSAHNKSQFEHHLRIAKSALRECVVYSTMAKGVGLFSDEQNEISRNYVLELTRMISALILSLQNGPRRRNPAPDASAENEDELSSVDTDFNTEFPDLQN